MCGGEFGAVEIGGGGRFPAHLNEHGIWSNIQTPHIRGHTEHPGHAVALLRIERQQSINDVYIYIYIFCESESSRRQLFAHIYILVCY